MQGSHYSDEQRRQAVVLYALHGNLERVSEQSAIPQQTLSAWKQTQWWETITSELRSAVTDSVVAKAEALLHQSLDAIGDRLQNGDTVSFADGDRKVPIKLRDAALTFTMLFDKRQIALRQPTSISASAGMSELAEFLRQKGREQKERTIEGERIDTPPKE